MSVRVEARSILDPARNREIRRVPDASDEQVDAAVGAAVDAFARGEWSQLSREERGSALLELAARLRVVEEEIAQLDSLNVGKPIVQARGDVATAAEFFDHCGRVVSTMTEELIENTGEQLTLVVREPVGVVAAIIPWNFPVTTAASAIAPALAAGNSVVLKPSPETPLSALRLAEVAEGVLPPGVLGVVTGGAEVGRRLAAHREVDRIAFTGSTATGSEIMRTAAERFARVGLELGGKSPTIVFEDAPFEAAVASALQRFTLNQGENCVAGSRLIVQESIAQPFLEALAEAAGALQVGDPQLEHTEIGPMISEAHRERVRGHMAQAEREAEALFMGGIPTEGELAAGFYVPVSIWRAGPGTRLWREEVFGPTLAVETFRDEAEAIRLANDSDYGLMAVIWSGERGRGLRVARSVRAGVVRINGAGSPTSGPWGGFGASGIGRSYGRYGIEESSEIKQINVDIS